MEVIRQIDTGELPSFFVDRQPAEKGPTCEKFSKSQAYWIGTNLKKDPVFGLAGQLFSATPPKHYSINVGGCAAWRYEATPKDWVLDVRPVSHGGVLYLFYLRNKRIFYDANRSAFEAAIASIHFLSALDPVGQPPNNTIEPTP